MTAYTSCVSALRPDVKRTSKPPSRRRTGILRAVKNCPDQNGRSILLLPLASGTAARPEMIEVLDGFREMLEDLGGGLGVTVG